MKEIVGVRFRNGGKIYYFSTEGLDIKEGDIVIVETSRGVEAGNVVTEKKTIDDERFSVPIKPIIRVAKQSDMKIISRNREREMEAFKVCEEKIAQRKLNMKLVEVECTFDNNKILFYFTAESRVDFRELVKDLASVFKTRIELRQIGVRDEAKVLGGIGICGREFCCKSYIGDFQPVSIKMAKEQGLSLNPVKISGTCGRLMCCLKYEQNSYEELLKITPKVGAIVSTSDGTKGRVEDVNLITGIIKVKTDKSEVPLTLSRSDVKILRDAEIKLNRDEIKALRNLEGK